MDKLAVELLTLISFYACTDGGSTGCSLSLVSKRIRAASRPARFYSVDLFSTPAKIEQFLHCLQAERSRATEALPRVRHLCLSLFGKGVDVAGGSSPPENPSTPMSQFKSRAEYMAAMQRRAQQWRSTQDNLDEQYNRIVPTLIRVVAPDVQTFALLQAQWRSSSVVRCQFPCLRELTLIGGDPSFLPFAFMPSSRPMYPALKRLHHILAFVGKDVDFLQWAQHAPNLTHLRVSRLGAQPRTTVDSLDEVINDASPDEFFPHLQFAMVQPHPVPPQIRGNNTTYLVYRGFVDHLHRIAERAKVQLIILPALEEPRMIPGMDPRKLCFLRLKKEWLERIEGGPGSWEEDRLGPRGH